MIPHSPEWFEMMKKRSPGQAAITAQLVELAGTIECCSTCGEVPSAVYKCIDEDGIICRACDDCLEMQQKRFGGVFELVV